MGKHTVSAGYILPKVEVLFQRIDKKEGCCGEWSSGAGFLMALRERLWYNQIVTENRLFSEENE